MKDRIVARALELGFDACRVGAATPPDHAQRFRAWLDEGSHGTMAYLERTAPRRMDPSLVLPGAQSVIALAASYYRPSAREGAGPSQPRQPRGVVARYAQAADYHDVLGPRLKALSAFVDELGGPGTRSLWYVDTGPILERDLAQRAGLGFTGKHTNLISRGLGNWFVIASILTTVRLEDDPPEPNRCGTCTRCIAACPTGAIVAPFHLDARRCISYLTIELKGPIPVELRPAMGARIFGCDDCLEACPWNRFAREGRAMSAVSREDFEQPALIDLLGLDEVEFKKRFRGTPLERSKRRGLLRNVCVALGNVGDESALAPLERAATDSEPLVSEHALWAIDQVRTRAAAHGRISPCSPGHGVDTVLWREGCEGHS